jgi:hypothetical protein
VACVLASVAPPRVARGIDRPRLVELMAQLADGDPSAPIALFGEYFGPLAAVVRIEARRRRVDLTDDDVRGLVLDVCFALAGCAGAWNPDGALPWVWARHRIAAVVDVWVGQFADSYDPERHADESGRVEVAWRGEDPPAVSVLEVLAARDPLLALFHLALSRAGSARDQEIFLTFTIQKQAGDPSPAVTVGEPLGLRPDAVRQVVARVRRRLRTLVATDDAYVMLDGLPLLD